MGPIACGCGKAGQTDQFQVTLPDGTTQVATSEVAARQLIARAGGGMWKRLQPA